MVPVTDVTGLHTDGSIHYTAFEHLGIGLGAGYHLFRILSTRTGTTSFEGRARNDALNVRMIDGATTVGGDGLVSSFEIGPHTITTGSGDDTINVGTRTGIGGRNFEGVLDEIDAVLTVIGLRRLDVDRLDIDDNGDTSANTDAAGTASMGWPSAQAGIVYSGNEALHVKLGSGNDYVHVASTHVGTPRISAAPGADLVIVESFDVVARKFVGVLRILDSKRRPSPSSWRRQSRRRCR
jgi:hypothetical protein